MGKEQIDKNFDALISALEHGINYGGEPVYFDMGLWFRRREAGVTLSQIEDVDYDHVEDVDNCGSAACLGGFIRVLQGCKYPDIAGYNFDEHGKKFLGLNDLQASRLFRPWEFPPHRDRLIGEFTRQRAIETVKHLKETGEVKWDFGESR